MQKWPSIIASPIIPTKKMPSQSTYQTRRLNSLKLIGYTFIKPRSRRQAGLEVNSSLLLMKTKHFSPLDKQRKQNKQESSTML
jgi:hypothetical protein